MNFQTGQEAFWCRDFGNDYIQRNLAAYCAHARRTISPDF